MTKLKNTKKGMAKKALSISLVAAMLATSNVPVWAAEFTDGEVAAFTSEVEVETPVVEEAPVVEDEVAPVEPIESFSEDENINLQASSSFNADAVAVKTEKMNQCWDQWSPLAGWFKDGSIIVDKEGNAVTDASALAKIKMTWNFGGEWSTENLLNVNSADLTKVSNFNMTEDTMKSHAGESMTLMLLEETTAGYEVIKTVSFGTIKKVKLDEAGFTVAPVSVTYNGTVQKVAPTTVTPGSTYVDLSALTASDFEWKFSTATDYVNANSKVAVVGTLKKEIKGFDTTLTAPVYTIAKRKLTAGDIVVKLKNPGKEFSYVNNANTEIAKEEVDVFLKDFSDGVTDVVASSINLNEYIDKVLLNTTNTGDQKVVVTFDSEKLKASANFTAATVSADSEAQAETKAEDTDKVVTVAKLKLTDCKVTLKTPVKADTNKTNVENAISVVIEKDGKVLNLVKGTDYDITLANGNYGTPSTYANAITVTGTGKVTGSVTVDLVTVKQAFTNPCFEKENSGWDYVTTNKDNLYNTAYNYTELDYNNGKSVEFKDMFSEKGVLGRFSPDGVSFGDQDNYRVTYSNNVNATNKDSVAKFTVTAVAGDYKGCSQDYYFRIAPSKVVLSTDKTVNTVTTKATATVPGVTLQEDYTDAAQYADAIGLDIKGTNGETDTTKKIVSEASTNDYTVEYSFVKANDHSAAGENVAKDQIKVVATLKDKGNFAGTTVGATTVNGVAGKIEQAADTNGVITLYVPILEKSIENLDISLKEDTFTFTGKVIKPEVVVKADGKTLAESKYSVLVDNGINAGTADIIVTVPGYTGTKTLHATINPADINTVKFEIKKDNVEEKTFTYNGKQQKPAIVQEDDPTTTKDETVSDTKANAEVKLGDVVLSKMFDITYGKNVDAGKDAGTVTLAPKAIYAKNFTGTSISATFDIYQAVLTGDTTANLKIKDATGKLIPVTNGKISEKLAWSGEGVKFHSAEVISTFTVTPAGVAFDEDDYEIAYVNNVDKTVKDASAYICVIGKGNFTGAYSIVADKDGKVTVKKTVDVEKANTTTAGTYTVLQSGVIEHTAAAFEITGKAFGAKDVTVANAVYAGGLPVKPVVTVTDPVTEKVLVEGTDYELTYDAGKVDATTTAIELTVVGKGQYNGTKIDKTADGKDLTFCIDKKDLKDCFVSVTLKDGKLDLTVMNGNVTESKEVFDVKDNGDGTATVSVTDGKNYTGSTTVKINDPAAIDEVGQAMIDTVKVVNNKATVVLSGEVDNATGYDYVISTENDYKNGRLTNGINKNILNTTTDYYYLQKGTYYAYCHAWTRGTDGKKVFGDWSNIFKFTVSTTTPDQPVITSVKRSGSTVKVTYTETKNATGYDVVLGGAVKKVHGEKRPVAYGTLVSKVKKGNVVTATFKNVKKGTYYAGLHAYNRTSVDNKKVFSPWSNVKKVVVK